jgi:hypothetical protein
MAKKMDWPTTKARKNSSSLISSRIQRWRMRQSCMCNKHQKSMVGSTNRVQADDNLCAEKTVTVWTASANYQPKRTWTERQQL